MIPDDYAAHINIENSKFNIISRPIYYRGIVTIMAKLFNIISPTHVYFTEYD
ncbi:pantoate--beta-alanine ligase, partial [Brachyspira hampsonii]